MSFRFISLHGSGLGTQTELTSGAFKFALYGPAWELDRRRDRVKSAPWVCGSRAREDSKGVVTGRLVCRVPR